MSAFTNINPLSDADVKRIKKMDHDDLVRHAQTLDLAVLVEAAIRLDRTTKLLNAILIALTLALVYFTVKWH